ncbi:hypothetical protein [Beijerinckia sp. L45]|uniref:hypothetical protein n=1 Tax=Beijerinckia sp. L45 TaxID=1641855 RepID=UPI00131D32FF|nr:hypothetical protein [Beijerinckia sp. L45]
MKIFSVCVILALTIHGACADEKSVDRNKMLAASLILGPEMQVSGNIVVDDDGRAHMDRIVSDEDSVTFEKVNECVYAGRAEKRGRQPTYAVIDFNKLDGQWSTHGSRMDMTGESEASCFQTLATKEQYCSAGVVIFSTVQARRLGDSLAYMLRHGCGGGDPKPY